MACRLQCWASRKMMRVAALDIIQLNVCVCGGTTEHSKMVATASASHARVIPHTFGTTTRLLLGAARLAARSG